MIDSRAFSSTLKSTLDNATAQLTASGTPEANFFIFYDYSTNNNKFPEIHIDARYKSGMKVVGKDLQDCVDEYIRRSGFATRQELIQLAAPLPAESDTSDTSDEISF